MLSTMSLMSNGMGGKVVGWVCLFASANRMFAADQMPQSIPMPRPDPDADFDGLRWIRGAEGDGLEAV